MIALPISKPIELDSFNIVRSLENDPFVQRFMEALAHPASHVHEVTVSDEWEVRKGQDRETRRLVLSTQGFKLGSELWRDSKCIDEKVRPLTEVDFHGSNGAVKNLPSTLAEQASTYLTRMKESYRLDLPESDGGTLSELAQLFETLQAQIETLSQPVLDYYGEWVHLLLNTSFIPPEKRAVQEALEARELASRSGKVYLSPDMIQNTMPPAFSTFILTASGSRISTTCYGMLGSPMLNDQRAPNMRDLLDLDQCGITPDDISEMWQETLRHLEHARSRTPPTSAPQELLPATPFPDPHSPLA